VARISGVDLPKNKRIDIALRYIYGIGPSLARAIMQETGVNPATRVKDLLDRDVKVLRESVGNYRVEGDMRKEVSANIKRLMDIGCYRGMRHRRGLPVRGQRTRTNARTRKGPKKTVGVVRKEAAQRMGPPTK